MAKRTQLSIETRSAVITLYKEGYSQVKISQKLKISRKGIQVTVHRWLETDSLQDRKRTGRPKATTIQENQYIKVLSKRNRRLTAPEIQCALNESRKESVSVATVKRRLAQSNLHGRIATRKPLLRKNNRLKRLQWAKQHEHWSIDDWSKVLWTDESKFEVFGTKRRIFVRRSADENMLPECIVPTVKHGGDSVMVWGCFSMKGIGHLYRIDGILKKEQYKEILKNHAIPSGLQLIGKGFIMQQDNDPKHTSKLCKKYLEGKEREGILQNMDWPPQSPDLNPIELLWEELDRAVRKKYPTSKEDLWKILQEAWYNIGVETIQKLITRIPRLCQAVKSKKGGFFCEKTV